MLTGAEERLHGFTTILSYAEKPPMAQSFFFLEGLHRYQDLTLSQNYLLKK